MSGISNGPVDHALELRSPSAAAAGSTKAETAIALDFSKLGEFKVVFFVDEVDNSTAGGWTLSVESDSADTFGSAVTLGSIAEVDPGQYEIPLSGAFVLAKDSTATFIRVKATLVGGGSEILYSAYVAPA